MLEYTFDDEENAIRVTRVIGYCVAVSLLACGVFLLDQRGRGRILGDRAGGSGYRRGVLSTLATRQTFWLQTAGERTLGDLLEAPHAVVSARQPTR